MIDLGKCPMCDAKGRYKEQRSGGNTVCYRGHTYPTCDAVPTVHEFKLTFNGLEIKQ